MATLEAKRERLRVYSAPEQPAGADREMDLLQWLFALMRNFHYIALSSILFALIAGIYSFLFATPVYQATATLYMVNTKDTVPSLSDLQVGSHLTSDYREVFKAWEVHEMVTEALSLDYSYAELSRMLTVRSPRGSHALNITISCKNALEAATMANTYARMARKYISETIFMEAPSILSAASPPSSPIRPNKTLNIFLGFALGAFLSVAAITVLLVFDDKVKTADDVLRCTNLSTLSIVPLVEWDKRKKPETAQAKERQRIAQ